ncbi:hypothetical protein AB0B25_06620 [Nocardia sp. NPDC049190]|uniref:hypothetical protein n=1 Tax=Nocardia sp. NPDC049190 TaxID=3155650 RepID=UPI00340CE4D7
MTGEPAQPARRIQWSLAVVVSVLVAAAGAVTRPFSWSANVLVALPVLAILVSAWRATPQHTRRTARLRRAVAVWSTLLIAATAWEAYAFVRQPDWIRPSVDHPTLSTLLDPALEHGPLRFVGWLAWLGIGWWLVSR